MDSNGSELIKSKTILIGATIFIAGFIFVSSGAISAINAFVASLILFWLIAKWANLPKA